MQQNMQDKMPVPPLPALFNHGVKQEVTTMDERVTGRVEEFDEARNSKYWGELSLLIRASTQRNHSSF